jgi:adenylate cyclase
MELKGFHRRLTAILSADVAGYSRLMQGDEAATVSTLESYKQAFADLIKLHRGRVVDSPGDNLLAEFASVVDAVQCAVAVQKELQARNAELPEMRRMLFRIGVHLGDVIEEGERIYGDGVNIAARLESLADPGGICVSKTTFDQIETKLPFGYEFLGEQTVKNMAKPVGTYKVLMEPRVTKRKGARRGAQGAGRRMAAVGLLGVLAVMAGVALWQFLLRPGPAAVEKADPSKMAFPLPHKPSIAVLPFANTSGDPQQEFFSDGITEALITALSKAPRLFVIARNSSFSFKGTAVKVQKIAEELGVRYVLEGSVQRSGDRLRISSQLIDAVTGHLLWSDRYERESQDVFLLQDDIAIKVLTALQGRLVEGDQALVRSRGTQNLKAYEKFLQSTEFHYQFTRDAGLKALAACREALDLDPEYAAAYGLLSNILLAEVRHMWTKTPAEIMEQAHQMASKALEIDPQCLTALLGMGQIQMLKRNYDEAVAWGERAVGTYPNAANAEAFLGWFLSKASRPEEAIPLLRQAMRRNPFPPGWYSVILCAALRQTGRFGDAIGEGRKAVAYSPDDLLSHMVLAAAYSQAGRLEEARAEAAEVLRIQPMFSLEMYSAIMAFKNPADTEQIKEALRKAGLPEKPPMRQAGLK